VSAQTRVRSLAARLWASRWPEVAWAVFAVGNLAWMVLVPSWSMLPYHFTWISLLLLYGLGYRTATRGLIWWLLVPVMAGAALLFADARIRAMAPYDELIELPVMVVLLFAISKHTGRRKAAMAALDDVSRRNAELLERQRAFVQNASHELRTPITVALAHAELLPGSTPDAADTGTEDASDAAAADAASRGSGGSGGNGGSGGSGGNGANGANGANATSDAAIVVDELGRLRRLVDRLLLLATAERHDAARLIPIPLLRLVDDALRRWEPTPRRWQRDGCDDVTVLADPDRLTVAIDALLDNAVRFTRDGDSIDVSVRRHGSEAALTIADSGPGIPDNQLESVFDRFERAAPLRDSARHFGLGLSIVRAIAEAHGGRATAGPGPAGGAAVTIWLPLRAPSADVSPAAALDSARGT
jgi:signal transduction histidine kinase